MTGTSNTASSYRQVVAHPEWGGENRFSLGQLREAAAAGEILFRGWPFVFVDPGGEHTRELPGRIETEIDLEHMRGHGYRERWELSCSGLFLHHASMEEDSIHEIARQGSFLDLTLTIYHVSEAIGSLWRLYAAAGVGDSERVTMEFEIGGMKGRRVEALLGQRAPLNLSTACEGETVRHVVEQPLGTWRVRDVETARDTCAELFEQAGWLEPNLTAIEEGIREFLGRRLRAAV